MTSPSWSSRSRGSTLTSDPPPLHRPTLQLPMRQPAPYWHPVIGFLRCRRRHWFAPKATGTADVPPLATIGRGMGDNHVVE